MPLEHPRPRGGKPPRISRLLLALVFLGTAACAKDITVHVRAGDRPPDPDLEALVATDIEQPLLASGVAIDRLQIVLRNIRLQPIVVTDGAPTADDASISPPLVLVDLTGRQLDPGAMTEVVGARSISWRSFYQSALDLRPVSQEEVAANPELAPLLGRTVLIAGRLPGDVPFTWESSISTTVVRPATYREGLNHNNVTINIAPNRWFVGPNGEALDPRDPAAHATIEANVLQSIDGYMDDNTDGNPDSLG